jgi:hypothetical protein
MSEKRKKPGMAFWATVVVVVLLVLYPLSMGPWIAIYVSTHQHQSHMVVPFAVYKPIYTAIQNSPPEVAEAYGRFIVWWMDVGDSIGKRWR